MEYARPPGALPTQVVEITSVLTELYERERMHTEAAGGKDTAAPTETVDEAQQAGAEAYAYAAAKLSALDADDQSILYTPLFTYADKGRRYMRRALELNPAHPILLRINELPENDPIASLVIQQVFEDALLIEGLHPDPSGMIERIQKLMEAAIGQSSQGRQSGPSPE